MTRPPVRCLTAPTTSSTPSASRAPGTTQRISRCSGSMATWSHQSPRWSSAGSNGSQCSCFLKTNDHFSSNWTSRVFGGKSPELVVQLPGVSAGQAAVPDHRIGGHPDLASRGADAVAVGEVPEEGDRLILGQLGAEQGRPSPRGEPVAAGAAVEQPVLLVFAVAGADGQVAEAPLAVVGASLVLAAEAGQVLVHDSTSRTRQERRSRREAIGSRRFADFNGLETPPNFTRRARPA